jgi:hypothetical protein
MYAHHVPNILVYQLSAPLSRGPYSDLFRWMNMVGTCPFSGSVERSLWGGFHADRLGYAFVAGYGAALRRLFEHAANAQSLEAGKSCPTAPTKRKVVALAATESGGAHPRAIATRLDKQGGALFLRGEKTFATLATVADEILVVASRGPGPDGNNRLRVVRVAAGAKGMRIEPRGETPFAPEIPHARIVFDDVLIEDRDVLPGDGYLHWLKPFRTLEDIHVLASTVGYLVGVARAFAWSKDVLAELTSLALALVDVGARDASAPLTHVLLAGIFGQARSLLTRLEPEWAKIASEERLRWERDRALLSVAETVRQKRTETAWDTLATSASRPSLPTPSTPFEPGPPSR